MTAVPSQLALAERVLEAATGAALRVRPVLLAGPPGAGKRVVAQAAAGLAGLRFEYCPLDGSPRDVFARVFGTADRPGALGRDRNHLVYLDRWAAPDEQAHPEVVRAVGTALRDLKFTAAGQAVEMDPELFVVASATAADPPTWVTRTKERVIPFDPVPPVLVGPPTGSAELRAVAAALLGPGRPLAGGDAVDALLREAAAAPDHLRTLHRWLLRLAAAGLVGPAELDAARSADEDHFLRRIGYRGRSLAQSRAAYRAWQDGLPEPARPLAVVLLRHIAERYYFDEAAVHTAVAWLADQVGVGGGRPVVFCKWQPEGKSAPAFAHRLKTAGGWKVHTDLDLTPRAVSWPEADRPPTFLFPDDFIGSGRTVRRLLESEAFGELLARYPDSRCHLVSVAGLADGVAAVRQSVRRVAGGRVKVHVARQFDTADRVLDPTSRVLPDPADRTRLRQAVEAVGSRYHGHAPAYWWGYEEGQVLVVFPYTVPNNSLALLWMPSNGWPALFPESG